VLNKGLEAKVRERTVELEEKNEELELVARMDGLTRLPNRRAFEEAVAKEMERARRTGREMVVGLMDLDYFKKVNDNYGHDVGDRALIAAAKTLKNNVAIIKLERIYTLFVI